MDWFLHDNGLRHEKIKSLKGGKNMFFGIIALLGMGKYTKCIFCEETLPKEITKKLKLEEKL